MDQNIYFNSQTHKKLKYLFSKESLAKMAAKILKVTSRIAKVLATAHKVS